MRGQDTVPVERCAVGAPTQVSSCDAELKRRMFMKTRRDESCGERSEPAKSERGASRVGGLGACQRPTRSREGAAGDGAPAGRTLELSPDASLRRGEQSEPAKSEREAERVALGVWGLASDPLVRAKVLLG